MTTERKEIIRVSGLTIVIVMVTFAVLLVVGIIMRNHDYQAFALEKKHNKEYAGYVLKDHLLKNDIVKLEGVQNWNETMYASSTSDRTQASF